MECMIQGEITARQRVQTILKSAYIRDIGPQELLERLIGALGGEINQLIYAGVVRRGIAELFK